MKFFLSAAWRTYSLSAYLLICMYTHAQAQVTFESSNVRLDSAFAWAKMKALSFAHDGGDPVGYWYEAALPQREAFCMRDVSHQAIGAALLRLNQHNLNMFKKFAENISAEKDYCSYWEINRYNQPAPIDYENDSDFWYNLPANFDVVYNAWRLYQWTGDKNYLQHTAFQKFYALSMDNYVDHWHLGNDQVMQRTRQLHSSNAQRFGANRGIPTYNEGGRGETKLGIDLTAALIAAYRAYAEILKLNGEPEKATTYRNKANREKKFLNEFWWDKAKQEYRSVQYTDQSFDYFMVGKDQAFLHYLLYFDVIENPSYVSQLMEQYRKNYPQLIVELKSYLPILFYENGYSQLATQMIIDLCAPTNTRRDYPENSFTIIEHVTRGLMGVEADVTSNTVTTLSRVEAGDWAELKMFPVFSNTVSVKHRGTNATTFTSESGGTLTWRAGMPGHHNYLFVNGVKQKCDSGIDHGRPYALIDVAVKPGETMQVSVNPSE
ncbi:MAG: hypothetical protein ACOVMQ_10700 [Cyclobacteriaceae bacterium]